MSSTLRHFFVPHPGNDYKPHILHTKRAFLYSTLFVAMKVIVVMFAVLLPVQVFLLSDVLAEQSEKIIELTNTLRKEKGLAELKVVQPLNSSADAKAEDMATNGYFSHTGPDGHTLSYFLKQANYRYRYAGENLAMGFPDAESVVNAWVKSPTHYANLIDEDYTEFGVGLENGTYNGEPTVYVAEHFGEPEPAAAPEGKTVVTRQSTVKNYFVKNTVRGEKIAEVLPVTSTIEGEVEIDQTRSVVEWKDVENGTLLTVTAYVTGTVQTVTAAIDNYPIELHHTIADQYVGTLTINEKSDDLFRTIILPSLTVVGSDGKTMESALSWKNVKLVSGGPVEKYLRAKSMLSPLTNIFSVSKTIYLFFIIFFGAALVLNIVIEFRKQHYDTIVQTLLMIGLLGVLWFV